VSNVWLTSDLHIGHRRVTTLRGFDYTVEHDEAIRENWLDVVRKGDKVWVLGDIAVSSPAYALGFLAKLPGDKHLVWGNHDGGHPMHRDAHRKAACYLEVFASTQAFARRRVLGREVLLSHFPYFGDTEGRVKDRHTQYRLRDEGLPLIHGHTHSSSQFSTAPTRYPFTPQFHVGLDAHAMRLVPLSWVEDQIRTLYGPEA